MNARCLFAGLRLSVLCLATASPAFGLANRVFVSARSGNNANSCDNVNTPCQTLAEAMAQLNLDGEVIVLDSGGYGPVTITQGVTIEAPAGVTAFIHPPSGDAITINASSTDTVVLRGLVLNGGSGNGITVNTVGTLHIENCVINGMGLDGIHFSASGRLYVKDTISRNNGFFGVNVGGTTSFSADHCRLENNGSSGLAVDEGVTAAIRDSVASGNVSFGMRADTSGGTSQLNVDNCLVTNNATGLVVLGGGTATIRVSNSTISGNVQGLGQTGNGVIETYGNNRIRGNTSPNGGTITTVPTS